jgi:EAL domain-containing protein (putative c-di-GMP-specific phosphodiesterase class I)
MAHKMGIKVVAEGIETKEQLNILKEKDCDMIQGYIFSKPVASRTIEKLLNRQ